MSRNFKLRPDIWYIRKYRGDGAIYARCRCGYQYGCYKTVDKFKIKIGYTYPYCPQCGEFKRFLFMRDDIKERYYDRDN
jgi:hypothetical protein